MAQLIETSAAASARVKSTQQITRAMKMVAAAKLRRAQERALRRAPLRRAARTTMLATSVAARAASVTHPLLERRATDARRSSS